MIQKLILNKLKSWFEEVLPEYSRDKVYVSDIKKVALWYNILHKLNLLVKEEPENRRTETEDEPEARNPIGKREEERNRSCKRRNLKVRRAPQRRTPKPK